MDTKRQTDLTEEELAQVRRAMEDFGNAPLTPVVKVETAEEQETPVKKEEQPVKKRRKWVVWVAVAVVAALVIGIGYGYWAGLVQNHPNSMARREQTISGGKGIAAIKSDGTLYMDKEIVPFAGNTLRYTDLVSVSVSSAHMAAARSDGSVVFGGRRDFGWDSEEWKNVESVDTGRWHTVGLRSNGTVLAAGNNGFGQCDVQGWQDVIGIAAGDYFTAGLRADGTVVLTKTVYPEEKPFDYAVDEEIFSAMQLSLESVSTWQNIIAISAADTYLIGLRSDGTVVSAGYAKWGQCDVQDWADMVSISAGYNMSVGVRKDGTFVVSGMLYYYTAEDGARFPHDALAAQMADKKVVAATSNTDSIFLLDSEGTLHQFYCDAHKRYDNLVYKEVATGIRLP